MKTKICKYCGKEFIIKGFKIFCNESCRKGYWNKKKVSKKKRTNKRIFNEKCNYPGCTKKTSQGYLNSKSYCKEHYLLVRYQLNHNGGVKNGI